MNARRRRPPRKCVYTEGHPTPETPDSCGEGGTRPGAPVQRGRPPLHSGGGRRNAHENTPAGAACQLAASAFLRKCCTRPQRADAGTADFQRQTSVQARRRMHVGVRRREKEMCTRCRPHRRALPPRGVSAGFRTQGRFTGSRITGSGWPAAVHPETARRAASIEKISMAPRRASTPLPFPTPAGLLPRRRARRAVRLRGTVRGGRGAGKLRSLRRACEARCSQGPRISGPAERPGAGSG